MKYILVIMRTRVGSTPVRRQVDYSLFSVDNIAADDLESQRSALENWITERANPQHDADLVLVDWEIKEPARALFEGQKDKIDPEARFLSVNVYRYETDCTNQGATSPMWEGRKFAVACSTGNLSGADCVEFDYCVLEVQSKKHFSHRPAHISARPVGLPTARHSMMGGNFIYTSDSRFRDEVSEQPIPVHDRVEG